MISSPRPDTVGDPPGDTVGSTIFDGLVAISTSQWDQFARHGLLRTDISRTWAALHPLILVLGTAILRKQSDRHLTRTTN